MGLSHNYYHIQKKFLNFPEGVKQQVNVDLFYFQMEFLLRLVLQDLYMKTITVIIKFIFEHTKEKIDSIIYLIKTKTIYELKIVACDYEYIYKNIKLLIYF